MVARVLPVAEIIVGLCLITGVLGRLAALAAALLLSAFVAGLSVNLLRGRRDLDCGCFAFGAADGVPHISWFHPARAGGLAVAALVLALAPAPAVDPLARIAATALGLLVLLGTVAVGQMWAVVHVGRRPVDEYLTQAAIRLRAASAESRYGS
jgi:hypothetical protein